LRRRRCLARHRQDLEEVVTESIRFGAVGLPGSIAPNAINTGWSVMMAR
jgi:hypothetical protein